MWWRGATCDTLVQWHVTPRGNIMWCLGTIAANAVRGALGQWRVMPWGNGTWCRGEMPGDSLIGWFFWNIWFGVLSAKWQKKDHCRKNKHLHWATIKLYVYHYHEGVRKLFDFVSIFEFGKLLIIIWFYFILFFFILHYKLFHQYVDLTNHNQKLTRRFENKSRVRWGKTPPLRISPHI